MRQRVHVPKLAVLHAEQVRVRRTAAPIRASGSERAEHRDSAELLVHDETAIGDVHASRNAYFAAVRRLAFTGIRAALDTHTRKAPRHLVDLLLEEGIEIG